MKRARESSDRGGNTPNKKDKKEDRSAPNKNNTHEGTSGGQQPWQLSAGKKAKKKEKKT